MSRLFSGKDSTGDKPSVGSNKPRSTGIRYEKVAADSIFALGGSNIYEKEFARAELIEEMETRYEERAAERARHTRKPEYLRFQRVDPKRLERLYYLDGFVKEAIETVAREATKGGYILVSDDSDHPEVTELANRWAAKINLPRFVFNSFRYLGIYGNDFLENGLNETGDSIVSLYQIDPVSMDYKREAGIFGKVLLDRWGKPISFVQRTIYGTWLELPRNMISHIKLFTLSDSEFGIGLIEPNYKKILGKVNMEESLSMAIARKGSPKIVITLGSADNPPTPEDARKAEEILKKLEHKDELVLPYTFDFKIHDVDLNNISEHLDHIMDDVCASFMSGLKFKMFGGGSDEDRITFDNAEKALQLWVGDQYKKEIFDRQAKLANWPCSFHMQWNEISSESLDKKANRLLTYVKSGLLTNDIEVRQLIRKWENLPAEPKIDMPPVGTVPNQPIQNDPNLVPPETKSTEAEIDKAPQQIPHPDMAEGNESMPPHMEYGADTLIGDSAAKLDKSFLGLKQLLRDVNFNARYLSNPGVRNDIRKVIADAGDLAFHNGVKQGFDGAGKEMPPEGSFQRDTLDDADYSKNEIKKIQDRCISEIEKADQEGRDPSSAVEAVFANLKNRAPMLAHEIVRKNYHNGKKWAMEQLGEAQATIKQGPRDLSPKCAGIAGRVYPLASVPDCPLAPWCECEIDFVRPNIQEAPQAPPVEPQEPKGDTNAPNENDRREQA